MLHKTYTVTYWSRRWSDLHIRGGPKKRSQCICLLVSFKRLDQM